MSLWSLKNNLENFVLCWQSNCWGICCSKPFTVVRLTQNYVFLFTLWLFCLRFSSHIDVPTVKPSDCNKRKHNISTWHYVIIVCLLDYITCVPHYTIVYMLVIWFSLTDYFSILRVVLVLMYCWTVSQFCCSLLL